MEAIYLLAIDLGKRHFQVCGTDVSGKVLFNRKRSFLGTLMPGLVPGLVSRPVF